MVSRSLKSSVFPASTPLALISLTVTISAIAVLYGGWRAFYFQSSFLAPIAFITDERPTAEVFSPLLGVPSSEILMGIHGFHDFLISYYWGGLSNPWTQNALDFWPNHSPLAMLMGRAWNQFGVATARNLNLVLMALAMLAPIIAGVWRKDWTIKALALSVTLVSGPFIASLDRGNYQGYIPLLLFAFAWFALTNRWGWAGATVVLAGSFKLYPLVLILVLIAERKWRACLGTLTGLALFNFALLFAFQGSVIETGRIYLSFVMPILGQQESELLSYNISFAGGTLHWFLLAGEDQLAEILMNRNAILVLIGVALVAPILWMRAWVPLTIRIIAAMMLTTLVTPVVFPYTANWAVAAFALVLLTSSRATDTQHLAGVCATRSQRVGVVFSVGLVLAFMPVYIPGSFESGYPAGAASLMTPVAIVVFSATMWFPYVTRFIERSRVRRTVL